MKNRSTGRSGPPDPRSFASLKGPGQVSPKAGVIGLVVCFVVVVGAFFGLYVFDDDGGKKPGAEPPGRLPGVEFVDPSDVAAMLPDDAKLQIERDLGAWFADPARAPIDDAAAVDESEWVEHLLDPALYRAILRLPNRVYGELDNVPDTIEEPASRRGKLVRVWGKVEAVRRQTLSVDGGPREAWVVEFSDQHGVPWSATALDEPAAEIEGGVWIKAYGVFVKTWPATGGRPAPHLFLTRPLVKSYPPVRELAPKTSWLEEVKDGDPRDPRSTKIEDGPFYGMLNYVRTLGPAGYRQARDTDKFQVFDLTSTDGARPLIRTPLNYRFQAVRLRLAPSYPTFAIEQVNDENPGNIESVYHGYATDDQQSLVHLVTPFPRDEFRLQEARLIEVEGFFYKARQVETNGGKHIWMPVVIVTQMTPVAWEREAGDPRVAVAIVACGSLCVIAVFLIALLRNRRERSAFEARQTERRARRQGASRGA